MYKVLIVDDEDLIREGLKTFVKWNEMGFEVVGEAADGNQAFEIIKKLKPHVLLTDIKMPSCTGIDLMNRIKESGIDVKIVVLSGYDEFEYAKAALEVGAVDYLLKPIKFDKLKEVFSKIKEDYDRKTQESIKMTKAMNTLRSQFFTNIIDGVVKNPEDISKQARELNINLSCKYYITIIVEMDDYSALAGKYSARDLDVYKFAIRNVSEEICLKYGESYTFPAHEAEVVVIYGSDEDESGNIKSLAYELKSGIDSVIDFTVTISVGDIFENIAELYLSYAECRKRADRKFILGKDRIIFPEDAKAPEAVNAPDANIEGKLLLFIRNRDKQGISDLLDRHFSAFRSRDIICEQFFAILRLIAKYLRKNGINTSELIDENRIDYASIRNKDTLADILSELKTIIGNVIDHLSSEELSNNNMIIGEVKEFVTRHFKEDISLEAVAQKVHLHPMYLSKVFKKETGVNFIDFLTNVRINKARELMHDSSLKMYEISGLVGYRSSKHFSKVFKDITGVTPKDYRKNLLGYEEQE